MGSIYKRGSRTTKLHLAQRTIGGAKGEDLLFPFLRGNSNDVLARAVQNADAQVDVLREEAALTGDLGLIAMIDAQIRQRQFSFLYFGSCDTVLWRPQGGAICAKDPVENAWSMTRICATDPTGFPGGPAANLPPEFEADVTLHGFVFALLDSPLIGVCFKLDGKSFFRTLRHVGLEMTFAANDDVASGLTAALERRPAVLEFMGEFEKVLSASRARPIVEAVRNDLGWRFTKSYFGNGHKYGPIGNFLQSTTARRLAWSDETRTQLGRENALRRTVGRAFTAKQWHSAIVASATLNLGLSTGDDDSHLPPAARADAWFCLQDLQRVLNVSEPEMFLTTADDFEGLSLY